MYVIVHIIIMQGVFLHALHNLSLETLVCQTHFYTNESRHRLVHE